MKIVRLNETPLEEIITTAAETLRNGGLVIFPTETTYGAGVDALNQAAVDKLLAYKARREGKPLSIAVTDQAMAEKYVEVNESAARIYQRFLPGPVTVVSKSKGQTAKGVDSEFGTLGIRIPAYPLVLDIVRQLTHPVTATSANGSGEKRPYTIEDILNNLSEKQKSLIDLIIDAGTLPPNPPSTVIDTTLSAPVVFRQGKVNMDAKVSQAKPGDPSESNMDAKAAVPTTTLVSLSEQETKDIAKRFLLKHWNTVKETGLLIGLNGSLGMGKTVFVKGIAEFLQIEETITSPTYSYIEEYDFNRHNVHGKLYHLDVWKVEQSEEMNRLEFPSLLKPNHVVVVEWADNVESYLQQLTQHQHFPYLHISFNQEGEKRLLQIQE